MGHANAVGPTSNEGSFFPVFNLFSLRFISNNFDYFPETSDGDCSAGLNVLYLSDSLLDKPIVDSLLTE